MGSIISLDIGKFQLDWGKNGLFVDYSALFQKNDLKMENHYYANDVVVEQEALSSPLSKVKKRLNLLGYTLKSVRQTYNFFKKEHAAYSSKKILLSFEEFFEILKGIEIDKIKIRKMDKDYWESDFGKYVSWIIAQKMHVTNFKTWVVSVGAFFESLDPLLIIRILSENPKNIKENIVWRFHDVLEGGYIEKNDVLRGPEESIKYLIVTEGSTDLFVIRKALELFHPEIIDFFHFIDMQDNYPFTGCSNLYKFLLGLSKVRPINKVVAIFDNDTAGNEQFNLCKKAVLPSNIKITKLPEVSIFKRFLTEGPTGKKIKNINGTAVSIECFLDLNYKVSGSPIVRWASYNERMNSYQGSLEQKEKYVRIFKGVRLKSKYDFSKIKVLCEHIINSCRNFDEKY